MIITEISKHLERDSFYCWSNVCLSVITLSVNRQCHIPRSSIRRCECSFITKPEDCVKAQVYDVNQQHCSAAVLVCKNKRPWF